MKKRIFTCILIILQLSLVLAVSVFSDSVVKNADNEKGEAGTVRTETGIEGAEGNKEAKEIEGTEGTGETEVTDDEAEKAEDGAEKTRILLLERALEPKEPYAAAKAWAEGVKTRNGALQYAVMSPDLKEEYYSFFVELGWITGTSSPWVESYEITEKYRLDSDMYKFEMKFTYTDSTASQFSMREYITVKNFSGNWLVSSIDKIDMEGEITELTLGEDKKLKSIFVENKSAEVHGYDKANVIIGSNTGIYEGYTDSRLSSSDLKEGMKVIVTFTGDPMIMIYPVSAEARIIRVVQEDILPEDAGGTIVYDNSQFGFRFLLPESWANFTVVTEYWEGMSVGDPAGDRVVETGPMLKIRHPLWTEQEPRQDIPIMVFTIEQWNSLNKDEFHIGAAPVGPKEIERSSRYVFALPARYNFAFPAGFEEVEEILENNPLKPFPGCS